MDEPQAAAALKNQDPGALQELVASYGDRLLRSACLLCGDRAEAQDLVQETFLQAFRGARKFEGRSGIYTWLHAILLNLTRRYHRTHHRLVYDEERVDQEIMPVDELPSPLDWDITSAALTAALRRLSGPHREVLVLRYFEDLKIHEMAAHLEVSPGTIKSRLHYALLEMQKRVPEEMNIFGSAGTKKEERL